MSRELEVKRVRQYLYSEAYGYKNAQTRKQICYALQMPDRKFRKIAQELKLTNDIASLSSIGYFFIPLYTTDPKEVEAVKHSIAEDYSRAYTQLKEAHTRIKRFNERFGKSKQLKFTGITESVSLGH